jgi:hypothetical protein
MDEKTKQLFLDIQTWMMDYDLEEQSDGKIIFERISELTGVDWNRQLGRYGTLKQK